MKKVNGLLIAIVVIAAVIVTISAILASLYLSVFFLGTIIDGTSFTKADIEIDSYRLCENEDGEDIIIIKYLLKNEGKEETSLFYEGEFSAYQNGIGLYEYIEKLPKECNYDTEDQYRSVKGGVEYYAEIAYLLENPDEDVEVEVVDYGFFDDKKEKVFKIK